MKKIFNNLKSFAIFAIIFWLIVSVGLVIACRHGFDMGVAIFISLSIIWLVFAIFLFHVFATDGKKAWNDRTTRRGKLCIRGVLIFYALCAVVLLTLVMKEMIIFLL